LAKVINAKTWQLVPASDGRRYSAYSDGNLPTVTPTWNLPATISVPAGSSVGVRQYTADADGWTIAVTSLATGLSYNSGTESIDAAETTAASGTATFTLSKAGEADVVDTATVELTDVGATDSYPRLAAIQIGTGATVTEDRLQEWARQHFVITPFWRTWSSGGYDIETLPAGLKKYNANARIFPYSNPWDVYENSTWAFCNNKIGSESSLNGNYDWWLRNSSGSRFNAVGNPSRYFVNIGDDVATDSNGLTWTQWWARWQNASPSDSGDWVQSSGKGLSQGDWDGVFLDNITLNRYYFESISADWDDDGTNDALETTKTNDLILYGQQAVVSEWRTLHPTRYVLGNLANLVSNINQPPNAGYSALFDGGVVEHAFRPEVWGGWDQMMTEYRRAFGFCQSPNLILFHVSLSDVNSRNPGIAYSDARWNRYFLTSCLMDNGYYFVTPGGYTEIGWFDEHGISLGDAIDGPQLSAWSNGVYRREFDNGLALVNPKGNGTRTVNVGAGWRRFSGTQDPTHNNGEVVTSVTLEAQDGIILVRE